MENGISPESGFSEEKGSCKKTKGSSEKSNIITWKIFLPLGNAPEKRSPDKNAGTV